MTALTNTDFANQFVADLQTAGVIDGTQAAALAPLLIALLPQWNDGSVSRTALAAALSAQVDSTTLWLNQLLDAANGTLTGGYNSDGTLSDSVYPHGGYYPFTDKLGASHYIACQLKSLDVVSSGAVVGVTESAAAAALSETNAADSATAAALSETNAADSATAAALSETAAEAAQTAAEAARDQAAAYATDFTATSTTSVTIGTGLLTWTIELNKSFQGNEFIQVSHDATNWVWGTVASYNPATGALGVNATIPGGAGTYASWNVSISGAQGSGTAASTLNGKADSAFVQAANNLSDLANANTARTNLGLNTAATHQEDDFLRVDTAAEGLTATEQANGRINLGLGASATQNVPRGHLAGLTLDTAGSSSTFSIAAGQAADSANAALMDLAAMSKTTSAWAVGSGNGALDTGGIASSTWYAVHLIQRPDTGLVDALISLSGSAPTLPASYTRSRRIGWLKTDASSHWKTFVQAGDKFLWAPGNQAAEFNGALGTTPQAQVIVGAPKSTCAIVHFLAFDGPAGNAHAYVSTGLMTNFGAADTATGQLTWNSTAGTADSGEFNVELDTTPAVWMAGSGVSISGQLTTMGWIDRRGRDA